MHLQYVELKSFERKLFTANKGIQDKSHYVRSKSEAT